MKPATKHLYEMLKKPQKMKVFFLVGVNMGIIGFLSFPFFFFLGGGGGVLKQVVDLKLTASGKPKA